MFKKDDYVIIKKLITESKEEKKYFTKYVGKTYQIKGMVDDRYMLPVPTRDGLSNITLWCEDELELTYIRPDYSYLRLGHEERQHNVGDTVILENPDCLMNCYSCPFKAKDKKAEVIQVLYLQGIYRYQVANNRGVCEAQAYQMRKATVKELSTHYNLGNLHIINANNRALIVIDKTTGNKGVAKCHPDDEFDFNIGLEIAMSKLNKVR
jgi:hypothetical protein